MLESMRTLRRDGWLEGVQSARDFYISCEEISLSKNSSQHREGGDGERGADEHGKGTEMLRVRLHQDVFVNDIGDDDAEREGK